MSLEDGQVAETPTPPEGSGTRGLLPATMPPLLPVPVLPSFEYEPTPTTEVSQEAKIEMWNKRIKWVFSGRLLFFRFD
jgi:hypothetical protein